jgi:hypothetical protein
MLPSLPAIGNLPIVDLAHPSLPWLLLLALPLIVLIPARRLAGTSRLLTGAIFGVRLLIVALLLFAVAEPSLRPAGQARAVVFALDVSDSQTPEQRLWSRAWAQRAGRTLPPGSQSQTIEFGEFARLLDADANPVPGSTTDLGAAMRLAGALLPRDSSLMPELVLIGDGWSTAATPPGDSLPQGVAVSYVVPPRQGRQAIAVVRSLQVPSMVRVGEDVEIGLEMRAAEMADAQLRVTLDRSVVADGMVHLDP